MLFRHLIFVLFILASTTAAVADGARSPSLASRDHPLPQATDLNLITAIDASDSITRHDEWLQYRGLARAVVDPAFLARISDGAEQRVGFIAFTWSSGGQIDVIVPWTVIESQADAERIAARFEAAPRTDRSTFGRYSPTTSSVDRSRGGMTDIAEALESAISLSMTAPFQAPRAVVNILSDGIDNYGPAPDAARDQAIALGITINAAVFGDRDDLPEYYRQHVIGGPGAFLMWINEPEDMQQTLEKKFLQDLIAALAEPPAG